MYVPQDLRMIHPPFHPLPSFLSNPIPSIRNSTLTTFLEPNHSIPLTPIPPPGTHTHYTLQPPCPKSTMPRTRKPPAPTNRTPYQAATPPPSGSTKPKKWHLPVAMDRGFTTFIDHGCKLDRQGYPLYPNRATKFVIPADSSFINFPKIGYSQTVNVDKRSHDLWKVITVKCLGVLLCDRDDCEYAGPPPTGPGKIAELLSTNPVCPGFANQCPGKVYWQECEGTRCRLDIHKTGWGLLRHEGFHNHPWPHPKKPDPLALADLADAIKKNPQATALQLKIGQATGPDKQLDTITDIHESLGNSDRARYYRREILKEIDEVEDKKGGGGDKFLNDMFQWDQKGLEVISCSFRRGREHFTFQSPWMSERLLDRSEDGNKLYSGGLISDVTYRFFESGYLLTTSMYCDAIQRWIPVQLSWIRGLSEDYYTIHFTVLFQQFLLHSILPEEREKLATSIVDFSKAQQKGFVAAYMNVFGKTDANEAMKKLKGCREHF
ncbi:hypothetical protein PTTG_30312, partial [Puccinia triticina 1-1 BBBD Race 1]